MSNFGIRPPSAFLERFDKLQMGSTHVNSEPSAIPTPVLTSTADHPELVISHFGCLLCLRQMIGPLLSIPGTFFLTPLDD